MGQSGRSHIRLGVALIENGGFVDHPDCEPMHPFEIHRPVLHLQINVIDIDAGQVAGILQRKIAGFETDEGIAAQRRLLVR
jgi:hypothetical protein